MSRQRCEGCDRPIAVCLCDAWVSLVSPVKVVILQHPSERKQALATVPLLQHCLSPLAVWSGEDFSQQPQITQWLADPAGVRVLFPAPAAEPWLCSASETGHENLVPVYQSANIHTLIVLDGTWRKAKRIWHLNPWLQALPCACLEGLPESDYRIRASQIEGGVSTLEAVVAALNFLTDDASGCGRFDPLKQPFRAMIDLQIKKMGIDVFNAHYGCTDESR